MLISIQSSLAAHLRSPLWPVPADEGPVRPQRQAFDRLQDRQISEGLPASGRCGVHGCVQCREPDFHEDASSSGLVVT